MAALGGDESVNGAPPNGAVGGAKRDPALEVGMGGKWCVVGVWSNTSARRMCGACAARRKNTLGAPLIKQFGGTESGGQVLPSSVM